MWYGTTGVMRALLALGVMLLVSAPIPAALGHSLFNSAEEFIGGYRVQIATLPEFPQIGEDSSLLLRVTDADFEEVERMTVGMRIFYNGDQIRATTPASVQGGHLETGFTFIESGNHIVRVDLYDVGERGVITYTFNISTQSPFGYIFIASITVGASLFAVLLGYIYLPKYIRGRFRS